MVPKDGGTTVHLHFHRALSIPAVLAMLLLASCSAPTKTTARTPDFYWSAAAETYAAGDYAKTADHLEHLLADGNPYTARAIPWHLVLTSGMARGYMDLADRYGSGARANKGKALEFRKNASKYRAAAGRQALRFAQEVDRLQQIPLGNVALAFPLAKGNIAEPPQLWQIATGNWPAPADQEAAEAAAVERGVLTTVCLFAVAPNDPAKARELLGRPGASITREAFANAVAQSLKAESALFARDKLDEPEKLAAFQKRAERVLAEGAKVGSARVGLLVSASPAQQ